jgi:hypothetical protein
LVGCKRSIALLMQRAVVLLLLTICVVGDL